MKISLQKITVLSMVVALGLVLSSVANAEETRPKMQALGDRMEQNRESRNTTLDQRKEMRNEASTTIRAARMEGHADMKAMHASSTDMFKKGKEMRKDIDKKMEVKTFEVRKAALLKELNLSLARIAEISTRIDTRITKAEAEGHSMTDVRALLVTANAKLAKAKADVAAFQAFTVTASTTSATATSSSQIELAKPRVLGDTAIKSVKEARDAFQRVIVAIAHSMGDHDTATSTPTTASTTKANQ